MDLDAMLAEWRQLIGQPDSSDSHFTNAQGILWANEFYRYACSRLRSVPITERSYTLAQTITLNAAVLAVDLVKFSNQATGKWEELEVIDLDDLMRLDPDWENSAAGVPTHLVRVGSFSARIYPTLNAAHLSLASGLKTFALENPTALSAGSDVPDLQQNIQDLFPHWMAYKAFRRLGESERATEELVMARAGVKEQAALVRQFSRKRGWTFVEGEE